MKLLNRLFHPGKEWDSYTRSWVREGWIAERQGFMDQGLAELKAGGGGTCLDCGHPIRDHPLPERMWRRGADLCAQVKPLLIDGTS